MKGGAMSDKCNKKKKVTMFLDTNTLLVLESVAQAELCSGSKSAAIRYLAREYERKNKDKG